MDLRLSDSELAVMRILWRDNRPLKISEFRDELEETRGWSKSTTQTIVTRMRDKGFIEPAERYGVARYLPLFSEDQYHLAEEKAVMERFGSPKALVLAMVRNGNLNDRDIDELREYFKMGGE
jgi:predicted transcriptional regulator